MLTSKAHQQASMLVGLVSLALQPRAHPPPNLAATEVTVPASKAQLQTSMLVGLVALALQPKGQALLLLQLSLLARASHARPQPLHRTAAMYVMVFRAAARLIGGDATHSLCAYAMECQESSGNG